MARGNVQVAGGSVLSVAQVAGGLGVQTETVRRYIRESKLKATKMKIPGQGLKTQWGVALEDLRTFCKESGLALDLEKLGAS